MGGSDSAALRGPRQVLFLNDTVGSLEGLKSGALDDGKEDIFVMDSSVTRPAPAIRTPVAMISSALLVLVLLVRVD